MSNLFQHGVASGDPLQDRVILWTRLSVPNRQDITVAWEIAEDPDFTRIVGAGEALALYDNDHSVHADAQGLQAGGRYYYRFCADNQFSLVGRTKTLPPEDVTHLRFAQVSSMPMRAWRSMRTLISSCI